MSAAPLSEHVICELFQNSFVLSVRLVPGLSIRGTESTCLLLPDPVQMELPRFGSQGVNRSGPQLLSTVDLICDS